MPKTYSLLSRLIDVYDYLVDEQVGIVQHVEEIPRLAGAPDFHQFGAQACSTRVFNGVKNFNRSGGVSTNRDVAMAKAIGEAVERYCSAQFYVDELPLYPAAEAPFPCVPPGEFAFNSAEQYAAPDFPWVPFTEHTPVRWAPALDLTTGEICHVPAATVYVPYFFYRGTGDAPIVQPISTGLACHCSLVESALNGICEVIERDAFTITWQAGLSRSHVRAETLSDANYDMVQRFERARYSVTILDLTMDVGVPTILSVLRGDGPGAAPIVFAAAAHLNPEHAVRKSLEELAHTGRYAQQIRSLMPPLPPDPTFENVADQKSHLNFWADPQNRPLADFVFASPDRIDFQDLENLETGDPEADLQIVVDKVRGVGHRVLVADITTDDVRSLGLYVTHAIIPGFHPLFMGYRGRALGGYRLWEIPQRLGYKGIARETGDNPAPHPYP
jgi:ribosomal protein S12 methylthiotransferase accessory factor